MAPVMGAIVKGMQHSTSISQTDKPHNNGESTLLTLEASLESYRYSAASIYHTPLHNSNNSTIVEHFPSSYPTKVNVEVGEKPLQMSLPWSHPDSINIMLSVWSC